MTTGRERTREYWARINRAVDYIDANLSEEITLQDIAAAAFFSPYHFHRIFKSLMGEPVQQFVQRVRLEKAARFLMADRRRSVTRIALECGYQNPAAFSRAFRTTFGCSPTQWRRGGYLKSKISTTVGKDGKEELAPNAYPPSEQDGPLGTMTRSRSMSEAFEMDVRVEDLPEVTIAYIRHIGPYAGDSELFKGLFGKLFAWAGPRQLIRPTESQIVSIYHDDPEVTDPENLRTSVGLSVPEDTDVSGEIGKLTMPGGTYAQAKFELLPHQYEAAWKAVYGEWLPQSGYQPEDGPPFERYLNNPEEHPEGKHIVEICLPVKPL
ncbi:MAG: AraC family transcriptional regulator [Gemmatimonadetes bacterium]|nr:AraC family transcriptional regulator [Gemmatimonadota bacterium]